MRLTVCVSKDLAGMIAAKAALCVRPIAEIKAE